MNKLIENYNSSLEALSEYFEIDNFGDYVIQECTEDYWEDLGGEIQYGNEDDPDYSNEYKEIIRKEELTAVLVVSDFGGDDYWNIFYTKNEIKNE